jgi:hypothetical protein
VSFDELLLNMAIIIVVAMAILVFVTWYIDP